MYRYHQADLQQQHRHRTWVRVVEGAHTQIYPAAMHMASTFMQYNRLLYVNIVSLPIMKFLTCKTIYRNLSMTLIN